MIERTIDEILSGEPVAVTLGGRVFRIGPQVVSWNRKFCKQAECLLAQYSDVIGEIASTATIGQISQLPIPKLMNAILALIGTAGPGLIELIYSYSKDLSEAREEIEETATIDQCVDALLVCMVLSFGPFGRIGTRIRGLMRGTTGNETTTPAPGS